MSQLALEKRAINLSQGFPDFDCSPELIELVNKYMKSGHNQYAPMAGLPSLRERIAEKTNLLYGSEYSFETDVTVTAGGTQALFTAIATTIQPNDEVIIFDPSYDSYAPTIRLFGGIVKPFELSPPDYNIEWAMVRRLVSANTKMIIINSPNNPTGKILTEHDIKELSNIVRGTDILILSDEVYEHLVFDSNTHLSLARYPELRERTFICASFGKLFHSTGWKIGYCLAPARLMNEFRKVHQFLVFSVNTPVQHAVAEFLENKYHYLELGEFYQQKRDSFRQLLLGSKFDLLPCEGSYFQLATYSKISDENDLEFCRRLTSEFGVAAIPVSAFYTKGNPFGVIRFCFAKKQETLEEAAERLRKV